MRDALVYGMEHDYAVPAKNRFEIIRMISKRLSGDARGGVATIVEVSE